MLKDLKAKKIVHQQVQDDPERRRRVAILGFGQEGRSLLKFLLKHGLTLIGTRIDTDKKPGIWILDSNPNIAKSEKRQAIRFQTGKIYLKNLDKFNIIFRSPGVPYLLPEIQKALKSGVKISSPTILFFEKAKAKIIGITGTKGKGTTATLLYKILKACGKNVYLAGNIGKPALDILESIRINQQNPHKSAFVILELSSFQLQDLKKSPDIAVILDIFPDHLDYHKNFKEYIEAKAAITKFQNRNDKVFYFADNKYSKWITRKSRAKKYPVSVRNFKLFKVEDLKIPGSHNFKNAVMAATIALSFGCPKEKIIAAIKKFRGNEHRLELIRVIKCDSKLRMHPNLRRRSKVTNISESTKKIFVDSHKFVVSDRFIKFYNDSASTNPQTAAAAVRAFKETKILIAGGKDKNLNYSPLAKALKSSNTKLVVLFGENKKKIHKAISKQELVTREVKNLQQAVQLAYKTAKSLVTSYRLPVTVLFSPASASFDMFENYKERGKIFKELVKKIEIIK